MFFEEASSRHQSPSGPVRQGTLWGIISKEPSGMLSLSNLRSERISLLASPRIAGKVNEKDVLSMPSPVPHSIDDSGRRIYVCPRESDIRKVPSHTTTFGLFLDRVFQNRTNPVTPQTPPAPALSLRISPFRAVPMISPDGPSSPGSPGRPTLRQDTITKLNEMIMEFDREYVDLNDSPTEVLLRVDTLSYVTTCLLYLQRLTLNLSMFNLDVHPGKSMEDARRRLETLRIKFVRLQQRIRSAVQQE